MAVDRAAKSADVSYGWQIRTLLTESLFYAILPVSLGSMFHQAVQGFATAWILNDDIQDPKSVTFQVRPDNIDRLAELLVQRKVTVVLGNLDRSDAATLKEGLKEIYRDSLREQSEIIQKWAQEKRIPIEFYIEIQKDTVPDCPYQAMGTQSFGQAAIIQFSPVPIKIPVTADLEALKATVKASIPVKEFLLAHEVSHIVHNDVKERCIGNLMKDIGTVAIWALGFFSAISWRIYLFKSLALSSMVQAVFISGLRAMSRRQELRADREAVKLLGTNEGAVQFFSGIQASPDPYYPSVGQRLEAIAKI